MDVRLSIEQNTTMPRSILNYDIEYTAKDGSVQKAKGEGSWSYVLKRVPKAQVAIFKGHLTSVLNPKTLRANISMVVTDSESGELISRQEHSVNLSRAQEYSKAEIEAETKFSFQFPRQ